MQLPIDMDTVKGFLDPREGIALAEAATSVTHLGPAVEIGSYCGKSTVYLGSALKAVGGVLLAIDHHRGSEENQPGEEYHDPELADGQGGMSSLPLFRDTLRRAALEDNVVPVVASSALAARALQGGFGFVFIDGGHSMAAALADYRNWAGRIVPGGILAIHDVFPNPADGGRPPHEIYKLALHSGMFREENVVASLRILRRL